MVCSNGSRGRAVYWQPFACVQGQRGGGEILAFITDHVTVVRGKAIALVSEILSMEGVHHIEGRVGSCLGPVEEGRYPDQVTPPLPPQVDLVGGRVPQPSDPSHPPLARVNLARERDPSLRSEFARISTI